MSADDNKRVVVITLTSVENIESIALVTLDQHHDIMVVWLQGHHSSLAHFDSPQIFSLLLLLYDMRH
jgi:hypothetical protein